MHDPTMPSNPVDQPPRSTTRILPPIDPGTTPPAAPFTLPGGVDWHTLPGVLGIASGAFAIGIVEKSGRTRTLRRRAERAAAKGGAR